MKNDKSLIKLKINELCEDDKVLNEFIITLVDIESGKGGRFRKKYENIINAHLKKWGGEDED